MFKYYPLGNSAFLVKVGDVISIDNHKLIRELVQGIEQLRISGIIELVPTYNELMVIYNPSKINYINLLDKLKSIESNLNPKDLLATKLITIPVCYDNKFAPDLEIVAKRNNLDVNEVIKIHSATKYLVYMLGFTPGFCYLGGMDKRIATPRKEVPRQLIEAGSVGIAGEQTGIYPIDSPGGWQLIGKTPIKLFDPNRNPEFIIEAGNYIKFNPVSVKEYLMIKKQVESKTYKLDFTVLSE